MKESDERWRDTLELLIYMIQTIQSKDSHAAEKLSLELITAFSGVVYLIFLSIFFQYVQNIENIQSMKRKNVWLENTRMCACILHVLLIFVFTDLSHAEHVLRMRKPTEIVGPIAIGCFKYSLSILEHDDTNFKTVTSPSVEINSHDVCCEMQTALR